MYIETVKELREMYGFPTEKAKRKQLGGLEKHSIKFVSLSPFVVVSTHDKNGRLDCSPRGGSPGFVKVLSPNCVLIPDGKGNNRLDSLVNIVATGNIGCLFLIPGVDETLRLNGAAKISTFSEHLKFFSSQKNPPKTCIEVEIREVFLHCAKSLMRSQLWLQESRVDRAELPTMGAMINDQLSIDEPPESQEQMIERYEKDL